MKRSGFRNKGGLPRKGGLSKNGLDRSKYRKKVTKARSRKSENLTERQREVQKYDRVFSLLTRATWADKNGNCKCFTCPHVAFWKQSTIQCGHYKSRAHMGTRWTRENGHPQCEYCNLLLGGAPSVYRMRLVETYGEEIIPRLDEEASRPVNLTVEELKKRRLAMEKELKKVREEKGL